MIVKSVSFKHEISATNRLQKVKLFVKNNKMLMSNDFDLYEIDSEKKGSSKKLHNFLIRVT